jgi:hypothetical protein
MKKSLFVASLGVALLSTSLASAGEYLPYIGADYVNMTPNVKDVMPDNYNLGSFVAGVRFVDIASIEAFAERSMREKNTIGNTVTRGRIYGYGADVLFNAYSLPESAILFSVGYGRLSTKLKYNGVADNDKANALRFGVGGEINPVPEWGFRAMFRYSLVDGDAFSNAKEFTLGARYYFRY